MGFAGRVSEVTKPVVKESVFNATEYVAEQIAKRKAAKLVESGGLRGAVKDFLKLAKRKLVDFTAPIEDVLADAVKKSDIKLPETQNIKNQIDRVLRAQTIAGQFAKLLILTGQKIRQEVHFLDFRTHLNTKRYCIGSPMSCVWGRLQMERKPGRQTNGALGVWASKRGKESRTHKPTDTSNQTTTQRLVLMRVRLSHSATVS